MSWLNGVWRRRIPITVDNNSGAGTVDVSVVLPSAWPQFWDEVDSAGDEIRITDSNGVTLLTYQLGAWNYAAKTATIEIDNWSPSSADGTVVCWLYWSSTSAQGNAAGSFSPASAKTGSVLACQPPPRCRMVPARPLPGNSDVPTEAYSWAVGEDGPVLFDLAGLLATHLGLYNGKANDEEVAAINVETRTGGAPYVAGNDPAKTRLLEIAGRPIVLMWLDGGANGTDYVDEISVTTTLGRELVFAARRYSRIPAES